MSMKASGQGFEGGRLHSACFCSRMHRPWLASIRLYVPLRIELEADWTWNACKHSGTRLTSANRQHDSCTLTVLIADIRTKRVGDGPVWEGRACVEEEEQVVIQRSGC